MDYVQLMVPIVRQAGELLLAQYRQPMSINVKSGYSLYTNVDIAIQQFLIQNLESLIPGSGVFAEEQSLATITEYTWVIDPIDGTKNFVRGVPSCAVSIALMHDDQIVAAVTYMPISQDIMYSQKGEGLWLNGKKIAFQPERWLTTGIVMGLSSVHVRSNDICRRIVSACRQMQQSVSFRVSGAATIDLAYVACGFLDVVFFENLPWWDCAAGILFITESGGMVLPYKNKLKAYMPVGFIAGDRKICEMLSLVL